MIPATLTHYRILRLLGRGGMGEVYLAEDLKLDRMVALKVLAGAVAADPDRRQRFDREAKAVAALNHPNIVTLHSVEEDQGVVFLTMELVEGRTLAELITPSGLALAALLKIAIPLADAVGAAHQRGITHRDLKPANVMVNADDRVKVLDFGLAKLHDVAALDETATQGSTGEGRIVGTVAYMAPEQAEGKRVDHRSDVFALGTVLFEMATGQRPFVGDTSVSVLSAIIKDTPKSVTDLRGDLPRELAKIVRRCLQKNPDDRYQTAKDLRNDLRGLQEELASGDIASATSPSSVAAPAPGLEKWRVLVAVALATVGAGGWWYLRPDSRPEPARAPLFSTIALTKLTSHGRAADAAISPDGRLVAYVKREGGQDSVWVRQLASGNDVCIVSPSATRYRSLFFSPDGEYLYFGTTPRGTEYDLQRMPSLGGVARKVVTNIHGAGIAPAGQRMALVRYDFKTQVSSLVTMASDGTGEQLLVSRKSPHFFVGTPAWAPDGARLAVVAASTETTGKMQWQILVRELTNGRDHIMPVPALSNTSIAWLPDGSGIVVPSAERLTTDRLQLWIVSYPSGERRQLTRDVSHYGGVSVARTAALVSTPDTARASLWVLPKGDAGRCPTDHVGNCLRLGPRLATRRPDCLHFRCQRVGIGVVLGRSRRFRSPPIDRRRAIARSDARRPTYCVLVRSVWPCRHPTDGSGWSQPESSDQRDVSFLLGAAR